MYKIQKISLPLKGMPYLTLIVLIYSTAAAMLIPVFPLYIKNLVFSNALVGYISAFVSFLLLIYTFLIRKLLFKFNKRTLLRFGFLGSSLTLVVLTIITNIKQFLILELFRTFFLVSIYITIGLFVREQTTSKSIGKTEGLHFSIFNMGYLIGPLLGGLLASAYSFNTLFLISAAILFIISILLFLVPLREKDHIQKHKIKIIDFLKNKELIKLYFVSFGIVAWWAILYTYMPLFANTSGFSTKIIGYALFAAVIPLILFEIPIGKLADKHGFKTYIAIGFLIISIITFLTYFTNPILTIFLIALATLGAAFIEPLTEAYFFKEVKTTEEEYDLYPIYKTSPEISHIIFPIIFSVILTFFEFKGLFLLVSLFMFSFAILSLSLKR